MPIANVTLIDRVTAALDTKSLQHAVIAQNIANRDAQQYQRVKLQFDDAMRGAAPKVVADVSTESVSLEQDLLAMTKNAGQYSALTTVLGRYFGILSTISSSTRG